MARQRSHYDTLGVDREVDADELRRAWKVLVQVWHPDRFDGDMRDHAEAQTARINEAYGVLRDAGSRAMYDARLDYDAGSTAAAAPAPVRASAPEPTVRAADRPIAVSAAADVTARSALTEFAQAFEEAARRYPRVVGSLAACLVLLFGGGFLYAHAGGPHVPAARLSALRSSLPQAQVSSEAAAEADKMLADMSVDGGGATSSSSPSAVHAPDPAPVTPEPQPTPTPEPTPVPGTAGQNPGWDPAYEEAPPVPRRIIRVMPKRTRR